MFRVWALTAAGPNDEKGYLIAVRMSVERPSLFDFGTALYGDVAYHIVEVDVIDTNTGKRLEV